MKYVIIFFDKSVLWVSEKQAHTIDDLWMSGKSQPFDIDGNIYTTNSISKILSEREYKEQYPDKQEQGQIFKNQFKELPEPQEKFNHQKAIDQMRRAYQKYVKN